MAPSNMPVILLVPGAFCTPATFDEMLSYLAKGGLEARPGPYPSCNPSDLAAATCGNDISALRDNILRPLVENDHREVIILAHSYGGVVGGAAAKGLDKPTRTAQGLPGGVIGLIYVAGNITLEGESLLEAVGGAYPPFIKQNKVSPWISFLD
jgi:pimeloyl-ACP methyl ester carboxylesterase